MPIKEVYCGNPKHSMDRSELWYASRRMHLENNLLYMWSSVKNNRKHLALWRPDVYLAKVLNLVKNRVHKKFITEEMHFCCKLPVIPNPQPPSKKKISKEHFRNGELKDNGSWEKRFGQVSGKFFFFFFKSLWKMLSILSGGAVCCTFSRLSNGMDYCNVRSDKSPLQAGWLCPRSWTIF